MITRDEAQIMLNYYNTLVEKLIAAKTALIEGGVKSYTIDNRSLTKFDLGTLSGEIEEAVRKRAEYRAILDGKRPRKAFGIVPRC